MAQQKMLLALCLFGAVACASAQMIDYQQCPRAVRLEADKLRESLSLSFQRFTQSLQQQGSQSLDTSNLQADIDRLSQSISSMADLSKGIDMSQFMSSYLENLQTITRIMRGSLRLTLVSGAMREYIQFGNQLYEANTGFLERVTNSCLPSNRRIVLPAETL